MTSVRHAWRGVGRPMAPSNGPPDPALFRSPARHRLLSRDGDLLVCPEGGTVGRMKGPVMSFLPWADPFYEGKYNNRTRYLPRGGGFLATLPLRVVLQGWPTTVAREVTAGATVVEIGGEAVSAAGRGRGA